MSLKDLQINIARSLLQPTSETNMQIATVLNGEDFMDFRNEIKEEAWKYTESVTSFMYPLVQRESLQEIWEKLFWPSNKILSIADAGIGFLRFISERNQAANLTDNPKILSLFRFAADYYKLYFSADTMFSSLPQAALLRHRCFAITKVENVVVDWFFSLHRKEKLDISEVVSHERVESTFLLILIKNIGKPLVKVFKIDSETICFLENQLNSSVKVTSLPASFSKLVEIGLCQNVSEINQINYEHQ